MTEAGEGPIPPLPPTYNVVAPAGTVMIMEGRIAHGTGVNHSDKPRRLIIGTAHKSFMRTQDTFGVSLLKEVYENAHPKLLERLGFSVETNTGHNGTEATGLAPGTVAPLRDGYLAVGELDAETGAAAREVEYTARNPKIRTLASIAAEQGAKL